MSEQIDRHREIEIQKHFYRGICTENEIERIFNPRTAADYLLKLRADTVTDHVRLYRVMLARARRASAQWSFEGHFNDSDFSSYLRFVKSEIRDKCISIPHGFILSNDPNGACMKTEFGNIIVISESLRHFLFFMNLAFLDFETDIPIEVRLSALCIAIRTMLKSESLDFEIDPRGNIPDHITMLCQQSTDQQIGFIVGHEFAHHNLNHLSSEMIHERPLFLPFRQEEAEPPARFYNYQQKQELEADEWSLINIPEWGGLRAIHAVSAVTFFVFLDVYSQVSEQMFPSTRRFETHPRPLDRVNNILDKAISASDFDPSELLALGDRYKEYLQHDVAVNFDEYEKYGSVYLGPWRGRILKDRIDY